MSNHLYYIALSKDELIEKWICEGIIDDSKNVHEAHDKGSEIIYNLVRSSLLMEEEDNIYMHDVVREMALWIASDFGKQKNNFVVHAGGGLCEMPKLKNWNAVKRLSLMANKIDHISGSMECLQLTTLFLQSNMETRLKTWNISGDFFNSMPKLVVLDLSDSRTLEELPDGISELVSLKYLNISHTSIQCLPVGLQKLENVIHLDLTMTYKLSSIVGISSLLNLKVLKLLHSGVAYSSKTNEELEVLEHLQILTINIDSDSGLDKFLSSQKLMRCTQALSIRRCQLESSYIWRLARMEKLRELWLWDCTISEIKMDTPSITREMVSPLQNLKNAFFFSLSTIRLFRCKCAKELMWLVFAPNLTSLILDENDDVEEIVNKEKAYEGEKSGIVPFQKLENLKLKRLPELKNIYLRPLPFPCLKKLYVSQCPKLRKLPLNAKSGSNGGKGLVIEAHRKWIKRVEWEDEATKAHFLASSSLFG